ncbi:MAG: DUF2288 domain-containing protein [Gammaproteobacteria bacterium]|nr:DUF2288 domain-containing protein [Gammaproteobacteria bacterium]
MTDEADKLLLKDKLNLETAQIEWSALARDFAAGRVISVHKSLDLVDVAKAFAEDDSKAVKTWMDCNQVHPVTDEQALAWHEADADVWAVVVRPWVLVQQSLVN